MKQIDLKDGVEIGNYSDWLLRLTEFVSQFSFVLRHGRKCLMCDELFEKLEPFHLNTRTTFKWPGTTLSDWGNKPATIYTFSFNRETVAVLLEFGPSVWDWLEPSLPEDLVIYRGDSSPIFVTITHEDAAFFLSNDDEVKLITQLLDEFGVEWSVH